MGGTSIELGRFDRDGNCSGMLTVDTPQPATPEAVLEAIENGQDPQPAVRRLSAAQPWDVIATGQAFVRDAIDCEQRAESGETRAGEPRT